MGAAAGAAILVLWIVSLGYLAFSAWCVRSFYAGAKLPSPACPARPAGLPPVTVLKPIRGAEPDTYENLKSFVTQDYPRHQVVFGVADPDDPARAVVERLIREYPGAELELVVTGPASEPNRKVGNLVRMYPSARYDIIVVADGDMRVGPYYLASVASGFSDPSVGLVTCLYRGAYPEDSGAALDALTIDTDFLPSVLAAVRLEGLSFAMGATMAVTRRALDGMGGFGTLREYLADDYMLGSLVRKAGYTLALSGYVVDSVARREGVGEYFAHQLRWGRTYRVCRPWGWFASVLTKSTALALLYLLASGFSAAGWAVFAAGVGVRYAQAAFTESYVRGPGVMRCLWLLPVKDLAGFVIWFMSFTGSAVSWKGERFRVGADGKMARVN